VSRRDDSRKATETLQEIEGVLDRAAGWVASNPKLVLLLLGAVVGTAALVGGAQWWIERGKLSASGAVAEVTHDYFEAMGATPGAVTVPEPANPETARAAREKYAAKFAEVAEAHSGSAAAVEAWIEAGNLREQLGDPDGALAAWESAAQSAPAGSAVGGLALARLAAGFESADRWSEAADAWEKAGGIDAYPLRHEALAFAARARVEAGEPERAIALYDRIEADAPDFDLPPHLVAQRDELRAR
jgi:tetratricopeptide (TPR) repeat protein